MDNSNAVAIVGMGLRFPDANNKHEFWRNLRAGRDSVRTVSAEDLKARGANPADLQKPNYVKRAATIEGSDLFDAGFFALTTREAQLADPQLRVMLEVCQEAIEDSGHVLENTRTGVYVGAAENDFWLSSLIYNHPEALGASLGNRIYIKKDYFATQLSHKLNLRGPSVSMSTACSTSLVAVHEAVTHLLMFDCDYAIAGGCEIDQACGYLYEEGGILSPDGCCRVFSAAANGTIFGSGCGMVVLRRYEDAIRDRDHIYAVILSARINNDGRVKAGFTAPSVAGQSEVIYDTICTAGIGAEAISYVEAHGTGTLVGDPIEVQSLARTFERFTDKKGFCAIGSVKSNVGHLSVAAGVAGLIKTALALQNQELPPTLHFDAPNPNIDFANSPFFVNTALRPWPASEVPRVAAVSAFGVGGTNAHAILQEAPLPEPSGAARPFQLLTVSAKSQEAMLRGRENLLKFLESDADIVLPDVAYTLLTGRQGFTHRCALVCAAGAEHAAIRSAPWSEGTVKSAHKPGVAFMFPGQGSQYVGMSRQLYAQEPVFRETVDRCAQLLESHLGVDLRELIYSSDATREEAHGLLRQTRFTQPALFVVSYATAQLLLSWGIQPRYLIGHSIGEYVAACLAGVLALEDCLYVVSQRGALMQSAPAGAMLAVTTSVNELVKLLPDDLDLAAVNGPAQCVVAGTEAAVERFAAQLRASGTASQRVPNSHAFHSRLMDAVLDEFAAVLRRVRLNAPRLDFMSNVTGKLITAEQAQDPQYWVQHLRGTVNFQQGVQALQELGTEWFLEVGPGTTLSTLVRQGDGNAIATLRHPKASVDDNSFLMSSLAEMWVAGLDIDWTAFFEHEQRNRLSLPTYAFQRKPYWFPAAQESQAVAALTRKIVHPLLGQRWASSARTKAYENVISPESPHFLTDHRLMNTAIFPGAGYTEMALAAARLQLREQPAIRLERIQFERALMFDGNDARQVQTIVVPDGSGRCTFEIGSFAKMRKPGVEDRWQLHSSGSFCQSTAPQPVIDIDALRARIANAASMDFYEAESIKYGPCFRALAGLWTQGNEVLARLELPAPAAAGADDYWLHPVLLDACFQAIGGYSFIGTGEARAALPVGLVNVDVWGRVPRTAWVHIKVGDADLEQVLSGGALSGASITIIDDTGSAVAHIERYERKEMAAELLGEREAFEELFYEIDWQSQDALEITASAEPPAQVVILTDDVANAAALGQALTKAGCRNVAVHDYSDDPEVATVVRTQLASTTGSAEIVMLRTASDALGANQLCNVLLQAIQAAGAESSRQVTLAIVTKGCQQVANVPVRNAADAASAALWGMGTAVTKEYPALKCLRLDLDPDQAFTPWPVCDELRRTSPEDIVAHRGHTRYVARLQQLQPTNAESSSTEPFRVELAEFGTFDALRCRPLSRRSVGPDEVEVEIHAAGLNFKETLISLGMLDLGYPTGPSVPMGFEGAGVIVSAGRNVSNVALGDRVIIWANGCLASHITTHKLNVIPMRDSRLTFEQAACLPTVFMTAWYGLHTLAKMRRGDRVLIHAAAGGVGQAAIQIARAAGAEIYATASRGKWEFLRRQGIEHIFDSRTPAFADELLRATAGKGVDIVLNALTGEFITRSFDVLAPSGRFIEIGKLNIWSTQRASEYRPDVEYHPFELGVGTAAGEGLLEQLLRPTLDALDAGSFEPPALRVFPVADVVPAFRWLAAGRNIGKAAVCLRKPRRNSAQARIESGKQYLITGGLGALGLHVADWLARQGAGELVLLSRREPSGSVREELERLRKLGVQIRVASCDVGEREQLAALIAELPRLAGVYHVAGALDDGIIANQTAERFERVLRSKVQGVEYLHELTAHRTLDQFVCFSSTSAMLDGAGQANYAAANAYLDAFVSYRAGAGLAALSIAWGAWAGAGMAAKLAGKKGAEFIDKDEGMAALEQLLAAGATHAVFSRMRAKLQRELTPLFKALTGQAAAERSGGVTDFKSALEASPTTAVSELLRTQVSKVLGVSAEEIGDHDSFIEAGIDSLMLAELRNKVQKALAKTVPVSAFYANATVAALTGYIVAENFATGPATAAPVAAPLTSEIIQLSTCSGAPTLFCVPGAGDNVFDFKYVAESDLRASVAVLHLAAELPATLPTDEITFIAKLHFERIQRTQPDGPLHIVGYSFGGSIAVEVVNQALRHGREVASLTLLDAMPSFWHRKNRDYKRTAQLVLFDTIAESVALPQEHLHALLKKVADKSQQEAVQIFRQDMEQFLGGTDVRGQDLDGLITAFDRRIDIAYDPPGELGDLRIAHVKANNYLHNLGRLIGVEFKGPIVTENGSYGWEEILSNEICITKLECSHAQLVRPPYVSRVVQILAATLHEANIEAAQRRSSKAAALETAEV